MNHTKGEWRVVAEEQDELAVAVDFDYSDTGYLYIATIHEVGYPDSQETLPNANLIAAAPELLAACEAFVEAWEKSLQLEKTDTALRMARAAIVKATGEVAAD